MPQTTYNRDYDVAVAGMVADSALHAEVTSKALSEAVSPGCFVVLDAAGTVSLPKTAGGIPANGTGSLVGVVMYDDARGIAGPGFAYQVGEMVPIMRQGRIWANAQLTAAMTENKAIQISGASDNSGGKLAQRGFVTDAAANTTVGTEATASVRAVGRGGLGTTGTTIALIELNLP